MLKRLNNLLLKTEMALGRTKVWSLPKYAQIEPTNRCNQKCIFCPRNEDNYSVPLGDMSLENFKNILKQIPTLTDIQINGLGEPLLNKDIFAMIKWAKNKKNTVTMNSNVALADEKKAKELIESGLDVLKISMDSTNQKVYRSLRHGELNQVTQGIKNIVNARKRANSIKPSIWFNSIIVNQNVDNLMDILKLARDLEIDQVRFKPIDTFDLYADKNLVVNNEKLLNKLKEVNQQSKDLKIHHNLEKLIASFSSYYRPPTALPCFSPWYEVYIQYYGGVRLCCEFYDKKYDVGNMFEEDFKKVWNNEKMQAIRKRFRKGDTFFPVCNTCNRFQRNLQIYHKLRKLKIK